MNIFICKVNPKAKLIEMVVTLDDRILLAAWQPIKYPDRVRLEKVIKGKSLEKDRFVAFTEALPIVLREQFTGKTIRQWVEMEGSAFSVDATLEAL